MIQIRQTVNYRAWFDGLKDKQVKSKILIRLKRVAAGNFGTVAAVGEGVAELKFDIGPGYRIYFFRYGEELLFLLGGGDKSSQSKDIVEAKELARNLKEQR